MLIALGNLRQTTTQRYAAIWSICV